MAVAKGLYHFPCPDGITAALACFLGLKQRGISLQLIPHTTFTPLSIDDLGITVSIHPCWVDTLIKFSFKFSYNV